MNETKHLFDDKDKENFYLLSEVEEDSYMETTVTNSVAATDWSACSSVWVEVQFLQPRRRLLSIDIQQCVKFAVYFVVFTRVGSLKGSLTVEGDNGYLKVGCSI